jgi:hypothetical protein
MVGWKWRKRDRTTARSAETAKPHENFANDWLFIHGAALLAERCFGDGYSVKWWSSRGTTLSAALSVPPRSTLALFTEWRARVKRTGPDALVFSTWWGKPISPHNVTRRWIVPACTKLGLPNATWLTFRRTYASWSHDKGVPGKVVAKLMGHTNADVTRNVYTQAKDDSLRTAVDRVGNELFNIVHSDEGRLDSVPLAASVASRGATGGQPESHE